MNNEYNINLILLPIGINENRLLLLLNSFPTIILSIIVSLGNYHILIIPIVISFIFNTAIMLLILSKDRVNTNKAWRLDQEGVYFYSRSLLFTDIINLRSIIPWKIDNMKEFIKWSDIKYIKNVIIDIKFRMGVRIESNDGRNIFIPKKTNRYYQILDILQKKGLIKYVNTYFE